jgi:hypothetical protein
MDAAASAAERQVPVYTVVLGAQKEGGGGANADLLNQIATSTGAGVRDRPDIERAVERLRGTRLPAVVAAQDQQLAQLFVFIAIALASRRAVILLLTTQRRN